MTTAICPVKFNMADRIIRHVARSLATPQRAGSTRAEYGKLERTLTDAEVAGWL